MVGNRNHNWPRLCAYVYFRVRRYRYNKQRLYALRTVRCKVNPFKVRMRCEVVANLVDVVRWYAAATNVANVNLCTWTFDFDNIFAVLTNPVRTCTD